MFVELSYPLEEKGITYPDNPPTYFEEVERIERGATANTSMIHLFTHTGTHVDAPFHFCKEGWKLDEVPLEYFIFEHPVLVNREKNPMELFTLEDIEEINLEEVDLLMFRSGFARLREKDPATYRFLFPGISPELARFLREEVPSLRAIMLDFLSADPLVKGAKEGYLAHKWLLSKEFSQKRPIVIFEDVNLEPITSKKIKRVIAVPVRFKGLDGSPVSVVAEVE
ncbi:cyclase family protein [Thermotoga sp. KOL6]|uniref:cyclase family protein n=1 Tax=Thermotoga sp. KOL6 TaxID=126741 RepID=UPI000C77590C|nr:cyclase family protein [Thermotoga sp. KOL6]PLV58058.1 cyclase [Thermotoga sp. KOL6]